jgi:hypothetical protein
MLQMPVIPVPVVVVRAKAKVNTFAFIPIDSMLAMASIWIHYNKRNNNNNRQIIISWMSANYGSSLFVERETGEECNAMQGDEKHGMGQYAIVRYTHT